jgi:hypothetical protein
MPRLADTVRLNVRVEDAEHVRRRAADVDPDRVDALPLGDGLQDVAHRAGRGHDRRIGPLDEFVVAGRVRHHVLEEQVVDGVAGGVEVLALQHRPQVVDDRSGRPIRRTVSMIASCASCVARVDDRHAVRAAEARLGLGRGDELGDLDHLLRIAAVGAAGDQDHVRAQFADALDLLVRLADLSFDWR